MWQVDSVAGCLQVILTVLSLQKKKMFTCIFSLETLKKLEKSFPPWCHLIPVSPCNLCLFLEYLLCVKSPALSPVTQSVPDSLCPPDSPSEVAGWHLNFLGCILAVTLNSLPDMYLCLPSRPLIALIFKMCLMAAPHCLNGAF